jgi:hypothetical protein
VGSYLALVRPSGVQTGFVEVNGEPVPFFAFDKNYLVFEEQAESFFWPLEQIDRKVRPGAWDRFSQAFTSGVSKEPKIPK